jgi:hypothetical protein
MQDTYLFAGIGALVMLLGIVLFTRDGRKGANTIKFLGAEVSLSAPSLVIFIIGAGPFRISVHGLLQRPAPAGKAPARWHPAIAS